MKNNETFVNLSGWNKVMNKKLILNLALTLLLTTIGTAATWNVPANGNIQAAIDNADSGDTILLADGIYTGAGKKISTSAVKICKSKAQAAIRLIVSSIVRKAGARLFSETARQRPA